MVRHIMAASVFALSVGTGAALSQTPPQPPAGDTYIWHGELVSLDESARSVTVKARVLAEAATQAGGFNAGDRVVLLWSGLDRHAGAVRQIVTFDAAQTYQPLSLPVELASREVQDEMVTFRVSAPEIPSAVRSLTPGEWITVTSHRSPMGEAPAVVSIRPYVNSTPLAVAS